MGTFGRTLLAMLLVLLVVLKQSPRARVTLFNVLTYLSLTGWYYYRRLVVKKALFDNKARPNSSAENGKSHVATKENGLEPLTPSPHQQQQQQQRVKQSSDSTSSTASVSTCSVEHPTTTLAGSTRSSSNQRNSDSHSSEDRNSSASRSDVNLLANSERSSTSSQSSAKAHENHPHHRHHGLGFLKKLRIKTGSKHKRKAQQEELERRASRTQLATSPIMFESPEPSPSAGVTPPKSTSAAMNMPSSIHVPPSRPSSLSTGSVSDTAPRKRVYTGRKKPPNWGER